MKKILIAAATIVVVCGSSFTKAHKTPAVWFSLDSDGNPILTVKPTTQPNCPVSGSIFCAREYTNYVTFAGTDPVEYIPGTAIAGSTQLRS